MTPDKQAEPTRKERREQARTERKALEEAQVAAAARRKRLIQLGSVVGVVVVIVVVILIATAGGGTKKIAPGSTAATETVKTVSSLIGGVTQTGNVLGDPKAPVTMVYFGDLECPICKEFTLGAFPALVEKYVRKGKLKVEYRSLETATRNPTVFQEQQTSALAAGKQNLMWYFVELFYHEQGEEDTGYVTPSFLEGIARQVPGLSFEKWGTERQNPTLANQVISDEHTAAQNGFTGTPSFLIGKSGGALQKFEYTSVESASGFEEAINKLLA